MWEDYYAAVCMTFYPHVCMSTLVAKPGVWPNYKMVVFIKSAFYLAKMRVWIATTGNKVTTRLKALESRDDL